MNSTRLAVLHAAHTGIAKKVLDAVPINQAHSPKQILQELYRMGTRCDPKTLDGCLMTLLDSGVIRERSTNTFQQVVITTKDTAPMSSTNKPAPIFDRLAAVASTLSGIATELDDIALNLQSDGEAEKEELKQLRALKVMLSGLAGK